jgi:glycosyltransferase involved in cell wall biosynthesis
MKILLIAPHPFFQERGTPIAVRLLSETLCEFGYQVDILTYHEGSDFSVKGLQIFRIPKPPFVKNIPIGFSWKKVVADIFISLSLIWLIIKYRYDVIHAVEESIFPAFILNIFLKKKLIYDMDSSMADQLIEKNKSLNRYQKLLDGLEALAVRKADVIVPVCKYLANKARKYAPDKKIFILEDIAFESNNNIGTENIRQKFNLNGIIALYVGNLEHYQGIDLLLESAAKINSSIPFSIIIIGGSQSDILKYQKKAKNLNIAEKVYFIGPRLLKELPCYLSQADILLSPRIKGKNTPMKIYSYLASGKPVLATKIDSHLQVIDDVTAKMADPDPESFSKGLLELIENESLRNSLGKAGLMLAKNNYSIDSYKLKLKNIYDHISNY